MEYYKECYDILFLHNNIQGDILSRYKKIVIDCYSLL